MKMAGTETYNAVSGGTRTLRVVEPVSKEVQAKILEGIDKIKKEYIEKYNDSHRAKPAAKAKAAKEARLADPEATAAGKLRLAETLISSNPKRARERLTKIIEQYPETKAAKEAKELLRQMDEK